MTGSPAPAAGSDESPAPGGAAEGRLCAFARRAGLGAHPDWPAPLSTAADLCLLAPLPAAVAWGPDLVLLANDAWAETLGGAGRPVRDSWPALAPLLEDLVSSSRAATLAADVVGLPLACTPLRLADGS